MTDSGSSPDFDWLCHGELLRGGLHEQVGKFGRLKEERNWEEMGDSGAGGARFWMGLFSRCL